MSWILLYLIFCVVLFTAITAYDYSAYGYLTVGDFFGNTISSLMPVVNVIMAINMIWLGIRHTWVFIFDSDWADNFAKAWLKLMTTEVVRKK